MKKVVLSITILMVLLISACGNGEESGQNAEVPAILEVELNLPEEELQPGAEVTLETYVSQGGEAVEDANEVKFEVLKEGEADSEMLEGEHQGDGLYAATMLFAEAGSYKVTSHVTARDMHNMPSETLIIGNASEVEAEDTDAHSGESEHHHEHEGAVTVELQSDVEPQANQENELSVLVKEKDNPLTDAKVSFEISRKGQEKHEFIDAKETGNGIYKAGKAFESAGNYQLNVHINKDHLHEHQLFTLTVK
ncbi:FixH family protein [Mesobacillus maritimus]|uniref:FixH family protein n=1 Tax=Mesobacillus maritimus TaxID=1643336 RepID=UPI00204229B6|nr:FixH family protein [Mesobacillus maritimus]MCM3669135.1 FixH family protein [Mesobacillus maritimus]